jgi:tetratricopeptide (TPR) repeat protein
MDRRFGGQEPALVEAVALLEAGHPQEALALLEELRQPGRDNAPPEHLLLNSLAGSVRAHAFADCDQGQQALTCLEEALSLIDLEMCLMERMWQAVSTACSGEAGRLPPRPLSGSFQELLQALPPQAIDPVLLCCKAEALYALHEFEAAQSLFGFACVLDTWRTERSLPAAYFAHAGMLAAERAGDCGLALSLAAAAVEGITLGSPLAAPLCYNWAALLWELGELDDATTLYARVLLCDGSSGRACLAHRLSAEKLGVPVLPFARTPEVERQRATQAALYDTGRCLDEEEPRIWIPVFAAWHAQRANRLS